MSATNESARVLSVRRARGDALGACYYDAEEQVLAVLARTQVLGNKVERALSNLVEKVRPTKLVLAAQTSDEISEAAEKLCEQYSFTVERVSSRAFESDSAARRLEDLGFPASLLRTRLDRDHVVSLASVGGALHYVDRKQLLPAGKLARIELLNLDDYMIVNMESLHSLDVIREEMHPSVVRTNHKRKEGFSLLTLLDRAKSTLGRKMLRRWLLQPLANPNMINERLDCVEYLMHRSAMDHAAELGKHFAGLRDVPRFLTLLRARTAKSSDWMIFAESICALDAILDTLVQIVKDITNENGDTTGLPGPLEELVHVERTTLRSVEVLLASIDWEATKEQGWMVPNAGVSRPLDMARRQYDSCESILSEAEPALHNSLASCVSHAKEMFSLVFMPILGFLVQVQSVDFRRLKQIPADFTEVFRRPAAIDQRSSDAIASSPRNDDIVYLRCDVTHRLDAKYGDLFGNVRDLEEAFSRELEAHVLDKEQDLFAICTACAELDIYLAFAITSKEFDYVRPVFTPEPVMMFKGAKHPLIMHSLEQYVPNDIILGTEGRRALLITAPNYSGKSVLLKTVATLTIMAQVGCFVPAEEATLGVVERLFTRVESLESSSTLMESSFSIDVQQVANMLHNHTPRSLLLIDEFGKGTSSVDGASLLAATVRYFGRLGHEMPRILITTHFLEILNQGLVQDCQGIQPCEMKVLLDKTIEESDAGLSFAGKDGRCCATPIPLFQLVDGSASAKSFALACADRANVPRSILDRAAVILTLAEHEISPSQDMNRDAELCRLLRAIGMRDWQTAPQNEVMNLLKTINRIKDHQQE